jgi:hypothetical protein
MTDDQDVGFEVLTPVVMKSTIFRDITPCSPLKVNRINRARNQHESYTLISLLGIFFDLKMEAIYCSETSVDFQRTTRRYIPEDSTLQ